MAASLVQDAAGLLPADAVQAGGNSYFSAPAPAVASRFDSVGFSTMRHTL